MKIFLVGKGSDSILAEFKSVGINVTERLPEAGTVYNTGQVFEIAALVKDAIPFAAIASVLVAWLRARASRKIIVTRADGTTIQLEGLGPGDIAKVLSNATQLSVLETKKPDVSADDV